MKKIMIIFLISFNLVFSAGTAFIDDVIEGLVKSSDEVVEYHTKKNAKKTLEIGVRKYGDDVIGAVNIGGLDLLKAADSYSDEILELAVKNPNAIYSLSKNPDEVLSYFNRYGDIVLDLEGYTPGLTKDLIKNFGEDSISTLDKIKIRPDLTKLIAYGEKADSPSTRKLLFNEYTEKGPSIFKEIDYKVVMAGGLSASMIISSNNVSKGLKEGIVVMAEENPEELNNMFSLPFKPATTLLTVGLAVLLLIKAYTKIFPKDRSEKD